MNSLSVNFYRSLGVYGGVFICSCAVFSLYFLLVFLQSQNTSLGLIFGQCCNVFFNFVVVVVHNYYFLFEFQLQVGLQGRSKLFIIL